MEEKKNSIEENLISLDKLVKQMESGELTLEESLQAFEEGVKLVKESEKLLSNAEAKLKVLLEDGTTDDLS